MSDEIVIPTKERLGSYDAIETAKPGEPLFPIQGGDPFGPPTVLHWVNLARREGLRLQDSEQEKERKRGERLLEKATAAEQVAWAMQAYQKGHVQELERERQDEDAHSADTLDARHARTTLIRSSGRLHNYLSEVRAVAGVLRELGDEHATAAIRLEAAADMIGGVARDIEPRRGNERT